MSDVTDAPKERKPRFSLEEPGPLATLESEWLKAEKGLDVTPAQVRGVLMFHGEFQKSEARTSQVAAAREQRKADEEARKQAKADRKAAKLAEDAAKKARKEKASDDGVAAVAAAIENDGTASDVPEGPKTDAPAAPAKAAPAKRPARSKLSRPKAAKATAAADF